MTWLDDVIIAFCVDSNLSACHQVSESHGLRTQSRELAEQHGRNGQHELEAKDRDQTSSLVTLDLK
jgi:hypothetical protein